MKTLIQCSGGKYLWAKNGGKSEVIAFSNGGNTFEMFDIVDIGNGKYNIKCYDGHFIWAQNGGGTTVSATSGGGPFWEAFTPISLGNNQYAFKTHDGKHYLSAVNDGILDAKGISPTGACVFGATLKIKPEHETEHETEAGHMSRTVDLLPYFMPTADHANCGLNMRDIEWGKPKYRAIAQPQQNGDIDIFAVFDNNPQSYVGIKYIDSTKQLQLFVSCCDFGDTSDIWKSSGNSMATWVPRYWSVGSQMLIKNWFLDKYNAVTHELVEHAVIDSEYTMSFEYAGIMDVGGDLGPIPVIALMFWAGKRFGGNYEISYYALGWGQISWGMFDQYGKVVKETVWWTKIQPNAIILPDLSIIPFPYCSVSTTAKSGQNYPKDTMRLGRTVNEIENEFNACDRPTITDGVDRNSYKDTSYQSEFSGRMGSSACLFGLVHQPEER